MKPSYFAKYLSVEGEIKRGEYFKHSLTSDDIHVNMDITSIDHPDYKKVKLFLCSRDIEVGDEFSSNQGLGYNEFITGKVEKIIGNDVYMVGEKIPFSKSALIELENFYKVVGEISPEATWVKEGDKFYESEVFPVHTHHKITEEIIYVNHDGEVVDIPVYNIKGPCGHFH